MTGTTDKARSILLAALMVTSVFAGVIAFSGSATAEDSTLAPTVQSAVEYDDSGTSTIEISLSEASNSSITMSNVTVTKNGNDVTGDYSVGGDDGTSGKLVLTSSSQSVDPTDDLVVTLDAVDYSSGTHTLGDIEPTVTSYTVKAGNSGQSVYAGGKLAFIANNTDEGLDVLRGNDVIFNGSTGANSSVYVFNTANRNLSATYGFRTYESGTPTTTFTLRELTLEASADDTSITTDDALTVSVSENRGGANVQAVLMDANDDEVETQTKKLDGSGETTFDFGTQDAGNYTVEVTDVQTGKSATTETITVEEAAEGQLSLSQGITTEQLGDVASINISLTGTSTGVVHIGSDESGYEANVTVTDEDGDGTVMLRVNTYTMGGYNPGATFSAAGDDTVSSPEQDNLPSIIDTGDYDITVAAGTSYTADSQDVGTLSIRDRSTNNLTVWTAPQGTSASSVSDVLSAVEDGAVTKDTTIAKGDVVIHELDASGLEGALEVVDGDNTTDDFFTLANNGNLSLKVMQTNPSQNRQPKALNLGTSNTAVIADPVNDTYYLLTPTDGLQATRSGSSVDVNAGDEFNANLTVLAGGNLTDSDETVEAQFEFENREVTLDTNENDEVSVASAANQTISGTSTLASGSTVNIRVNSADPDEPFLKTGSATVGPNGKWNLNLNFSDVPAGTNFTVSARSGGTQLDSADGQVGGAATLEIASLDAPASVAQGETVTVTAEISNTGQAEGTETVEFRFDGDTVASEEVTVAAGATQSVEFSITADVEPGTYTHGVYVGDMNQTAEIEVTEGGTTAATTTAATTTAATTTAATTTAAGGETTTAAGGETTTEQPGTEEPGDDGGQPGFGIGVALVALVAAALLAVRRQN
ncbi:DUF7827 domain-containing protein [Haloarchaeobius sp. DT45]|uniref:DUF7827 domain-containing protein n=1 Tax=Haloarchaeobius sp. DT45 TaxID=3446116 RepID=UPI003F6B9742